MYNYIYDGQQHTDTSTDYLKNLGIDNEGIESLQRDESEHSAQLTDDFIQQRNGYLQESDWLVLRHNDQTALKAKTDMTNEEYNGLLIWRQQLRDMPDTGSVAYSSIVWPPLPPHLEDEFPDYPVRMKTEN